MAKVVVSYDPGLRRAGLARFADGVLIDVRLIRADGAATGVRQWVNMAWGTLNAIRATGTPDEFAFETMSTRRGMAAAHAALIELSIISGIIAGALLPSCKLVPVPANEWTRGRRKAVNAELMRRAILSPDEVEILDTACANTPKTNHKELTDAVGIGLFAVGRWP